MADNNDSSRSELDDLASRLAKKKSARDAELAKPLGDPSALGAALRLSTELAVAFAISAGIGWFLDRLFGTSPWLLIGFLGLGFAAGLLNVKRAMAEMEKKVLSDSDTKSD